MGITGKIGENTGFFYSAGGGVFLYNWIKAPAVFITCIFGEKKD
jgi:hypothetical protein